MSISENGHYPMRASASRRRGLLWQATTLVITPDGEVRRHKSYHLTRKAAMRELERRESRRNRGIA